MNETLRKNKSIILTWLGIIAILYIMTALQFPMILRNLFLVIATAASMLYHWRENAAEKWETVILILGLLARVCFCYLDVYTGFELPIGGSDDGIGFMRTAVEYYNGDFTTQYTKYPYILYAIFQVTGVNQYAAQYANILCWSFSSLLMQKACKRLEIKGIFRIIALAMFAWLPTNIWITSILYRDAYIMLLLLWSFYGLLCWMQDGSWCGFTISIVMVLLATMLHGGSIMTLAPIAFTFVFYSIKEKKLCINKRTIVLLSSVLGGLLIIFLVPQMRNIVLRKIPSMEGGLIEGLNRYLYNKYDGSTAGSDYLTGRYLTGYFDIIPMTIQRIFYHVLSPVPHTWRGIVDAVAFFGSSAMVYLSAFVLWIVSWGYKKLDSYRVVLFLNIFITVGVYAWGGKNAGTAMRHREKILSLVILLAVYSLNIIIQKRKERTENEKVKTIK